MSRVKQFINARRRVFNKLKFKSEAKQSIEEYKESRGINSGEDFNDDIDEADIDAVMSKLFDKVDSAKGRELTVKSNTEEPLEENLLIEFDDDEEEEQ